MSLKTLNYYGYSKEMYRNCLGYIRETDLHHAKILNIWFSFLCILVYILSKLNLSTLMSGSPKVYFIYFIMATVWNFIVLFSKSKTAVRAHTAAMMNIAFLYSFSIYVSVMQPYMAASIFPVIVVVIAFSYINTFFVMSLILLGGSGLFLLSSFWFKPLAITYIDIYNLLIFLSLAFIMHYSFQKKRISRFVSYYERKKMQQDLEIRSSFDALTSLLNRGRFFTIAGEIAKHNSAEEYIVLCLFDLDSFKQINDKLGHQMGDKAIQIASEHIMKGFQIDFGNKWDFVERAMKEKLSFAGRLGGDEFVVFLRGRKNREEIIAEAQKILDSLAEVKIGELNGIHSSVGVTELSVAKYDIDNAYTRADEALYQSKSAGKHRITFSED